MVMIKLEGNFLPLYIHDLKPFARGSLVYPSTPISNFGERKQISTLGASSIHHAQCSE